MPSTRHWKRQAAVGTFVLVVAIGALGCLFFLMAIAPCRVALSPGSVVSYRLTSEAVPLDAPGAEPTARLRELHLVCYDRGNQVALISSDAGGRRDELTLMRIDEDGRARRLDPARRLLEEGKAIGFFDFNLLPLPEGLDQSWRVDLVYAVPPPGKRRVQARVRRLTNSSRPEFELTLPTIEWIEHRPEERWCQIKNLVCRYRYDSRQGIVDRARIEFVAGVETRAGARFHRVRLTLDGRREPTVHDPIAVRDLALATAGVQVALEDGRRARLGPLVERLRGASAAGPERLQRLARELARAVDRVPAPPPGERGWAVQVATVGSGRRAHAERLAESLNADGWPAFVVDRGTLLSVCVGPYADRDPRVVAALRERFPHDRPFWTRMPR